MEFEKVTEIYRKMNLMMMSPVDYTVLLLESCLAAVKDCRATTEREKRYDMIEKAQKILFELMTVTNRERGDGNQLFYFYVHLNQCLVNVRIDDDEKQLENVEKYLTKMIASWESTKPIAGRLGYRRQDVMT